MKISILCVTYNRPEFHKFLLWNYQKQTYVNKELIIVDGSDTTFEHCFSVEDMKYIHMPSTANIPVKRNRALAEANGDIITWFDDDDWQHPDKCALLYDAIAAGGRIAGCKRALFYNLIQNGWRSYHGRKLLFNSLGVRTEYACAVKFDEHKQKASDAIWCKELFKQHGNYCKEITSCLLYFWICHNKNISNPAKLRSPGALSCEHSLLVTESELTFIRQCLLIQDQKQATAASEKLKTNIVQMKKSEHGYKDGISIIVAVRDRSGTHVENFFKTLFNQTFRQPYEIIVVDSFSQLSHQVSLEYFGRVYKIRYIRLDHDHIWNKPLALNVGIKKAKYEYCLLTDIDMLFQDNFLTELWRMFKVYNDRAIIHCQSNDLPQMALKQFPDVISDFNHLKSIAQPHMKAGNGACLGVKRSWLMKVRGLDERMLRWGSMDNDISERAKYDGKKIVWLTSTTFLHQWHIKKNELLKTNRNINHSWRENRKLLNTYREAWTKGTPLPDQVIRNNTVWGDCNHYETTSKAHVDLFTENRQLRNNRKISKNTVPKVHISDSLKPTPYKIKPIKNKNARCKSISLAINSCTADYASIDLIVTHLKKQLQIPFKQVIVFADFTAFQGKYAERKQHSNREQYKIALNRLIENRLIDTIIDVENIDKNLKRWINKDLNDKSHVGSPTFSYIASMLLPESEYILRMDSDILFYSHSNYQWVEKGIDYLEKNRNCLFYMTTPGPYTSDKRRMSSFRNGVQLIDGHAHYSTATTRYFLFDKKRFLQYCPLSVKNNAIRFEVLLSDMLQSNSLYRVCEYSDKSWHLHTNASSIIQQPDILKRIITSIENNSIPERQIGRYNFVKNAWSHLIDLKEK